MREPTCRELLRDLGLANKDYLTKPELAARVERVLAFCSESKTFWTCDLEHSDPAVRALARGRVSAAEQVVRLLDGGKQ